MFCCSDVCDTKYREKCEPYREERCEPYQRRQCDNKKRRECHTEYKDVPYTDEECNDRYVKKCEKIWVTDGYGGKKYQEDPHNCKDVKKTECHEVRKTRREPYQKCGYKTYEVRHQIN